MKLHKLVGVIAVSALFLGACEEESATNDTEEPKAESEATEETAETEEVAEEPSEELLSVGDSMTIDDVTMTINSVEFTDERNEYAETEPEKVIKINYTIKNEAEEDYPYGADFQVYADGSLMETYPNDSSVGSVSTGRSVDGVDHYGITGEEIEIEWEPLFSFSGEKGIWAVDPQ